MTDFRVDTDRVASLPTFERSEWLKNHNSTSNVSEAHPIDEKIIEETGTNLLQHYNLSAIQAVLSKTDILQNLDEYDAIEIEETETHIYYQVNSPVFYSLFVKAHNMYDLTLEIEESQRIAELHTIQFLKDLYNYTGDFGGQTAKEGDEMFNKTLCNALNDPTPSEGYLTRQKEPENAHYGYVDSRGLVFEKNTHN